MRIWIGLVLAVVAVMAVGAAIIMVAGFWWMSGDGMVDEQQQEALRELLESPEVREAEFDQKLGERVVAEVAAGRLSVGPDGVVRLPPELARVSRDGNVYVTEIAGARRLLFITWQGKGANLKGYLYVMAPLGAADVRKDAYGADLLSLVVPVPRGPSGEPGPATASVEVQIEDQLSPCWWRVSRSLD